MPTLIIITVNARRGTEDTHFPTHTPQPHSSTFPSSARSGLVFAAPHTATQDIFVGTIGSAAKGDVEAGMKYDFGALHSDSEVNSTGGGTRDGVQAEGFLLSDLESTRR